ncbi:MAG: ABC transporter ATP-binding protein [Clostridia bacterium]|nr:ABC transporter ATP-binding protein [Clostridia bacterium]
MAKAKQPTTQEPQENVYKHNAPTKKIIARFLPYYKKHIRTFAFDLFCAALTTACELLLPMIVRTITNAATGDSETVLTPGLILGMGGAYLFMRVIDTFANYYMAAMGHIMGTRIETDLRRDLFGHLQKLSFSYFNNAKVGVLMSRLTSDLFDITEFAHHCPEEFFIAGIKILGSGIILSFINIPLTLIILCMIPIMILCLLKVNRRMRDGFREQRRKVGELNADIEDSLLGIHVVKAFAGEEREKERFRKGNEAFLAVKAAVYKLMGQFSSTSRFFDGAMYIIVVVLGAFFILWGKINAADLFAYLLYVTTLFSSVRRIVDFSEQFNRGLTGIERFTEIMDTQPDIEDTPEAEEIGRAEGNITFNNVSFSYNDGTDVIHNFNLDVKKGQSIALVGPSGAGKTTLCSLIPRFYEINSGEILLDGKDIRNITMRSLRENIGIVEQDVYLFSGSVKENILYGKPDASDEEIEEAAKLAGAYEFIKELPDGFDTYVGERGVRLSGGQKQRISIARVFLKNPPVLLLDEATSALDNESERLVQQSLQALAKGRTTFTVAHRLTTIRNAERILVLTKDGVAEQGSHEELIQKDGLYAKMYKLYTTN